MARRKRAENPCVRCGRGSDMACPASDPLESLLDELADRGSETHFNDIDAHMARSPLSICTNCRARGRFTYIGMKSESSYRAFWMCRACRHWTEV